MPRLTCLLVVVVLLPATPARSQTAAIPPGESLVTDGIPPIPASIAEAARRYSEFRTAAFWDWHPTRREMLIGTRFGDAQQLHLVKIPGGARTQLTFFPDPVSGASYQPTDGRYVVFSKDVGGGEFFQKYRYDVATGDITLLTDGKSRNVGGVWSHRGDRYAYMSTRRNGRDLDLWVMDPADPRTDRMVLELEGGGYAPLDWSSDDRTMLLHQGISVNESYLWLVDVATGVKTLLTTKQGNDTVAYGSAQFGRDGKGIYLTTDLGSEVRRLAYLSLLGKRYRFLSDRLPWDVDEFALSPDGRWIAFVANEDGIGALHVINAATGAERRIPKLPAGLIGNVTWRRTGAELAFSFTSARSGEDAYSLDLVTGRLVRWTESETGGLNTADFAEPELIHWSSFDGRSVSGFLYKPPVRFAGRRPVIINIHGGPEGESRPGFLGRSNYYVNELGIALILPNVRGSTGHGKTFVKLDNGTLREGAYKDIGALFDWIRARPDLDPDHVLVTGGSYGGHMTLVTATLYNDRVCCSVDVVGISNLATFLKNTSGYRQDLRRVEYGDERDSTLRAWMERTAPLNNVDKVTKPLFIVAGMNDPRVPRTEAEQMVAALKQRSVPVWYLMAKDEGHGFRKKSNQDFQFYATILFTERYLLGREVSDLAP
ncbi:MAG: peptidase S9, prolyl oligopeptidase [Gemmatimonadetes bacterium]|nr:MAG: peptidase S9, prolyl oligopeptidase [Gemmatimonadota bacterium]